MKIVWKDNEKGFILNDFIPWQILYIKNDYCTSATSYMELFVMEGSFITKMILWGGRKGGKLIKKMLYFKSKAILTFISESTYSTWCNMGNTMYDYTLLTHVNQQVLSILSNWRNVLGQSWSMAETVLKWQDECNKTRKTYYTIIFLTMLIVTIWD